MGKKTEQKKMKVLIYSDGGARGNPGPAATGYVIYNQNGILLQEKGEYIGIATNNQAEYKALISALSVAKKLKAQEAVCYLDSELVVRQLLGEYKIKNPGLKELFKKTSSLISSFLKIDFKHIKREENKQADKLLNQVLDNLDK